MFGPAFFRVETAKEQHQKAGELCRFLGRHVLPRANLREDAFGFGWRAGIGGAVVQSVVGKTAPLLMETVVTFLQGVEKIGKLGYIHVRRRTEFVSPLVESFRILRLESPVWAEGRKYPGGEAGGGNLLMVLQRIGGVVGGANYPDVELFQDSVGGTVRLEQPTIGFLPRRLGGRLVQQRIDLEVSFELQMSPVIQRIAQGVGNRPRPGHELFVGRGATGAKALGLAIGPHRPPFVVIPFQPDLKQIGESPVFRNFFGGKMAVVVKDRLLLRILVIQTPGGFAVEKKMVSDEYHALKTPTVGSLLKIPLRTTERTAAICAQGYVVGPAKSSQWGPLLRRTSGFYEESTRRWRRVDGR